MSDNDLTLRMERVFNAPIDKVWAAWTDPTQIPKWFGPQPMSIPKHTWNASVGGDYSCVMRSPDGEEFTVTGKFTTLEPKSRIVMTWGWVEEGTRGHESIVDVRFEAKGDQTLMKFEHGKFESKEICERHNEGWTATWPAADAHFEGKGRAA